MILVGRIEALEFAEQGHPEMRQSTIDKCQSDVDAFSGLYPEAYVEVLKQRKGRRFTWSGIAYSQMEREIATVPVVYKLLSWDSHSTIGTLRDVRIKIEGDSATVTFGRSDDDPMANPARVAYVATEVLYHMFEDWRELWKLPPLHASREERED